MNRRSFFGAVAVLPAVAVAAPSVPAEYSRLSTEKGDPGYVPYSKLLGDKRKFRVLFNGAKRKGVITCDANEGWIKAHVLTERGNFAHDGKELLTEIVHGRVEIILDV
jgi:hypothetical protein